MGLKFAERLAQQGLDEETQELLESKGGGLDRFVGRYQRRGDTLSNLPDLTTSYMDLLGIDTQGERPVSSFFNSEQLQELSDLYPTKSSKAEQQKSADTESELSNTPSGE